MSWVKSIRLHTITPNREDSATRAQILAHGKEHKPSWTLVFYVQLGKRLTRRVYQEQAWYDANGALILGMQVKQHNHLPKQVSEEDLTIPAELRNGLREIALRWETGVMAALDGAGQLALTVTGYSGAEANPVVLTSIVESALTGQRMLYSFASGE